MKRTAFGRSFLAGLATTAALGAGCSSTPQGSGGPTASATQRLAGGQNDTNQVEANVVVELNNQSCSGTLITSTIVLTAAHCINGSSGKSGVAFPVIVGIGNTVGGPLGNYTVTSMAQTRTSVSGPVDTIGNDLALLFLDPNQFVLDSPNNPLQAGPQPYIVHPTLLGPDPSMPIGQAGWALLGSATFRQVAFDDNSNTGHNDDDPGSGWNNWEHIQGSIHVDPGDSGGPLFVVRTDARGHAYRDVFGVLHGVRQQTPGHDYDEYADISNQSPAGNAWLLSQLVDTGRSARWMAQHPGYSWFGDVEYPGTCDFGNDADCDHWTGPHDNCPNVYNPDQRDSNDDGIGDACTPVITGLSPSSGSNLGGTTVVISGSGFGTTGNTQVLFGTTSARGSVTCASSTQCTAVSPSVGANAFDNWVDVRVIVDTVWSAKVPQDVFTYTSGPICTSSFTCAGVGFGFPNAVATCSTNVDFYENNVVSGPPLGTGMTFTFPTNDVGVGAIACVPNGSCTSINTTESDRNYCGALPPPPPPPPTCNGVKKPIRTCGAGWHCCGTDGWACGVCS